MKDKNVKKALNLDIFVRTPYARQFLNCHLQKQHTNTDNKTLKHSDVNIYGLFSKRRSETIYYVLHLVAPSILFVVKNVYLQKVIISPHPRWNENSLFPFFSQCLTILNHFRINQKKKFFFQNHEK